MDNEASSPWEQFLLELKEAGGSTDMQTSKTGRYPWLYHFCRGQADKLNEVIIYSYINLYPKVGKTISSPPRDWRTKELIISDYKALKAHGGFFNDTLDALTE